MLKKLSILLILIPAILLSACGIVRTEPESAPTVSDGLQQIAYIPLDDRPDNYERMIYMAQSLDCELLMPDRELFATRLDGQPGPHMGDRAALYDWLVDCEENGCDKYIISLDQVLSGGLCASRSAGYNETITMSDGTLVTDTELLHMIVELLQKDGNNRVFLLDTVMRLAPTVGFDGWTLDDYTYIRDYFAKPRLILAEDELSCEKIFASYGLSVDGEEIPLPEGYDEADIERCTRARERKLLLTEELSKLLANDKNEIFTLLYGIDDSSEANCAQINEIAYINTLLRDGDALLSGVDDLGTKALCKLYLESVGWNGCTAELTYYGNMENATACEFDFHTLQELVDAHMEYFGVEQSEDAELKICVLTRPESEEIATGYCDELIDALNDFMDDEKPVILIDASNNNYGGYFRTRLAEDSEPGKLIAYAGQLDMAIVTGAALSFGIARYAYLQNGVGSELSEHGYMCALADSLIRDLCYRSNAKVGLNDYIVNVLNGDPNNLWATGTDPEAVNEELERLMGELVPQLIEKLESCNFISSLSPYTLKGWGGIEISGLNLPWYRSFEIAFDIKAGKSTEAHENILGVYYK